MSLIFPLIDPINGAGLVEELQLAGLPAEHLLVQGDELGVFGLDESHRAAAQVVVDAHTGQPTQARLEEQADAETRRLTVEQLRQLEVKARAVWQGTDTFTNAQAQRVIAGLVLMELRRRDG